MNAENFELASKLIGQSYSKQASNNRITIEKHIRQLLEQQKLLENGLSDGEIQLLLCELSSMDSNNFSSHVGAGEREGRIFSQIVKQRHFGFSHGIGRSGDVSAIQPKAAGSSLVNKLTNSLLLDLIKISGVHSAVRCFLVPVATGMSMTICMLYFRWLRPQARYVIWSRIDQKSCLKSIITAGYEPLIVEPIQNGDELQTDLEAIEKLLNSYGDQILCVLTTTSCFAPRIPDKIVQVGQLCKISNVPHLVNNAYGLQLSRCMNLIEQAFKQGGRVDLFVQSVDKNLMVPVGGAIVSGFDEKLVDAVAKSYPGRASISSSLDVLITLLSMGRSGWMKLLAERKQHFILLQESLTKLAAEHGNRVLHTPGNPISMAMTLTSLPTVFKDSPTKLGSMLFTRGISGARVVLSADQCPSLSLRASTANESLVVHINGFGCHSSAVCESYLNLAAGIGMSEKEVVQVLSTLQQVLKKQERKHKLDDSNSVP